MECGSWSHLEELEKASQRRGMGCPTANLEGSQALLGDPMDVATLAECGSTDYKGRSRIPVPGAGLDPLANSYQEYQGSNDSGCLTGETREFVLMCT